MHCGRVPGGEKLAELGLCPAATDRSFSGINAGQCGGRFCWAVAGTLCGDVVQGTFAEKRESCTQCNFYKRVQAEQGTANLRTKFLRFDYAGGNMALFDHLPLNPIKAGERFITQGEMGDAAYVIHRGACVELVEKKGILHPAGHRGEGDMVGMISMLTGEPAPFHVEAETDMDVWEINQSGLDDISRNNPDLLTFMTELIADRFDSNRPTADRTIGKYVAMEIIGRGGYSIVYKGVHAGLNMPVAIKMMRHDLAMRPVFLENFYNEARIIASLNHENIIRVLDIEQRFGTVFIIMEYLEGESLDERLKRLKTIPPLQAAGFIRQVCGAMDYAFSKGLIHRDINPKNILVMPDERIKLIDFGMACLAGTDDLHFGGETAYSAPELLDGDPADERSDIFALGVTAYELVTGEKPFPKATPAQTMITMKVREIPDPSDKVKGLPAPLAEIIQKACKNDPLKRYQNIKEMADDLDSLLKHPARYAVAPELSGMKKMMVFVNPGHCDPVELNRAIDDFSQRVHELGGFLKIDEK